MFHNQLNFSRVIVILSTVVLIAGLTACGGSAPTAPLAEAQPEEAYVESVVAVAVEQEVEVETMAEEAAAEESADYSQPVPTATAAPAAAAEAPIINNSPNNSRYFADEDPNPFIDTEDDHLSTFALDVDTASYSVARRYLNEGQLPPPDAIRVEEFVNYFKLNYPGPTPHEGAFAIHLEGAPAPFGSQSAYLLKVDLQGRRIFADNRKDANLVFVIDVSGSMSQENRLGLVKDSLRLLVDELRPNDTVGLVIYGSQARIVLDPTSADNRQTILAAINSLNSGGSTNAEDGLRLGYRMAAHAYQPEGINRVILLSDGVANVGRTGPEEILQVIRDQVAQGVTLSTVGVGMGDYNDVLMEQLADNGNGNYSYVDDIEEAHRIFVENLTGTLQTIAKDAKIQVDFNPELVRSYRLIGYENRAVADDDFRNDRVDAGEVGAGHSVTALYELKLQDDVLENNSQAPALTVQVRYQDVDTSEVIEVAQPFTPADFLTNLNQSTVEYRFIAAVAEYAEILGNSYWAKDNSLSEVQRLALSTESTLGSNPEVVEFINMLDQTYRLTGGQVNQ